MDMNTILQLISSVGFPIAVCLVLFWYVYNREKAHKEEIDKLRASLDNNTQVMQKLLDKIEFNNVK